MPHVVVITAASSVLGEQIVPDLLALGCFQAQVSSEGAPIIQEFLSRIVAPQDSLPYDGSIFCDKRFLR